MISKGKKTGALLERLSRTVLESAQRVDTAHPVFHGCIDWHSAVHAHWALLRAYKYLKHPSLLTWVLCSLKKRKALEKERQDLHRHPDFEMPYGRAWFLLLAMEYEEVTGFKTLRRFAQEVADSLLDFYTRHPPRAGRGEYQNAEWAFRRLYEHGRFHQDTKVIHFVARHRKVFLNTRIPFSFDTDYETYPEFFSRLGNYVHLLEVLVDTRTFLRKLRKSAPAGSALKPVPLFKNAHHLAVNYSRAWGWWSLYRKTREVRYQKAYIQHIRQGWTLHNRYQKDYLRYGHWIPQFGIYALTYPFEKPVLPLEAYP